MIDFFGGRETIYIKEINYQCLVQFERFLRTKRTVKRINQFGREVTTENDGLSDNTIGDYMAKIRTLFNACRDHYNDEDGENLLITHYPFKKYKAPAPQETKKRNITPSDIRKIIFSPGVELKRTRKLFARDMFLLTFYFAGINTADLFDLEPSAIRDNRLTYKRRKTRNRRKDGALISLKMEPEALEIVNRYRDPKNKFLFKFYQWYADDRNFNKAINIGLKELAADLEIPTELSTYYARHSWATIARNKCNISKHEVSECLNHVVDGLKTADIYIEKDWSFLDNANRKVLDCVLDKKELLLL